MSRIEVSREMSHARERVWEALADLKTHPQWMKDAQSVVFTTEKTHGVGTAMKVVTKVGPFRTVDVIEVVAWEPGHHIDVTHRGSVKGQGRLAVSQSPSGSTITWSETLLFPWWLGGAGGAWLASPILRSVWRGNLERLDRILAASD